MHPTIIYANGQGSGKGSHVSMFACLMKGDYDEYLDWPFQELITIQLLNQLEDKHHHTRRIDFSNTRVPEVVNRVTSGERAEGGWGTDTFISHADLGLNTDRNTLYLKDDTLKFRVFYGNSTAHIQRRDLMQEISAAIDPQVCSAPIDFFLQNFDWYWSRRACWYSPAFYTHEEGYRLHLVVYPNGFGDGQGSHISLFTQLMQGPFDEDLKWPFRGHVTIQIVNQENDDQHHQMTIPYTNDTGYVACRVTDETKAVEFGFAEFFPHSELHYNSEKKTRYLKDDTLKIRILKVKLQ